MYQSCYRIYASITYSQSDHGLVHSFVLMAVPSTPDTSFELNLRSSANKTLWTSIGFNGDGWWIVTGMFNHSLVIIHNGLYMKDISLTVNSAATIIYCTVAKARCKCTWAEQSESAGSYCGEIFGGIMTQLILKGRSNRV